MAQASWRKGDWHMQEVMVEQGAPTSNWRLAVYASPAMATYLAWMPLGFVIAKFYAKYTSLDLGTIGVIILVSRLFDAFTDPLIAYLSDRIDTRWGRRKPWIVLSAPVFATGFAMISMPPQEIHWSYFLTANIILYSGWTFFEVTHIAWGLEFERSPKRRANLGALLKLFAYLGSLSFFAYPLVFNAEPGSSEFTPPVMTAIGLTVAAAFPVLAILSVVIAPRERRLGDKKFDLRQALSEIAANKAFAQFLGAFGLWALADGLIIGLFIIYVDAYHGLASHEGVILLGTYFARVMMMPFAAMMIQRYPGAKIWIGCCLANAALFACIILIPQSEAALPLLIGLGFFVGLTDSVLGILAITLLGAVVDDDALRTGRDKAASYKAFVNIVEKTLRAGGVSGGLIIVGMAGLEIDQENTRFALTALAGVLALGPAFLNCLSAFLMARHEAALKAGKRTEALA